MEFVPGVLAEGQEYLWPPHDPAIRYDEWQLAYNRVQPWVAAIPLNHGLDWLQHARRLKYGIFCFCHKLLPDDP